MAQAKQLAEQVKGAAGRRRRRPGRARRAAVADPERGRRGRPRRRRGRLRRAARRWAPGATSPPRGSRPRDHLELGEGLGAIDMERGAKVSGARFYFLTGVGARLELALLNLAMDTGARRGLHADDHADPGAARDHGRHRVPRRARGRGLPPRGRRPVPRGHLRGGARRACTRTRSSTCRPVRCATPAGRPATAARPARTASDTRGIIRVHQFHKVEMFVLLPCRGRRGRARSACSAGRSRCSPPSSCPTA